MENIISFYYNLIVDKFKIINNGLIIDSANKLFIVKQIQDLEIFEELLPSINNNFYVPILSKEGKYYFEYNNKKYVLFEATTPSNIVGDNMIYIPIFTNKAIDYSKIWENNIDYFIKKITEMEKEDIEKINYLNYYIGMSENAIIINEKAKQMNGSSRISISHFRIKYPNYYLNYKDPTELLMDYISRDIAEYVKTKFFYDEMEINDLINLINKYNLSDKEVMFLFARLMYPNYYFDTFSEKNIEKQQIIHKKREKYELFLYNSIKQINSNNLYLNIDWLAH